MQAEEQLITITNPSDVSSVIEYLDAFQYVALDCETTGLEHNAKIIGFSVAAEIDVGIYFVLAYWDKEKQELIDIPGVKEACRPVINYLKSKALITQNGLVDYRWINNEFGVQLIGSAHTDVMILAHLNDENRASYGLKEMAFETFGADSKKEHAEMKASVIANGGVWEDKRGGNKEMYKADMSIMAKYGAKDTVLTLKMFYVEVEKLFAQGLEKFFYEDECMPLFRTATYELNTVGLKVDVAKLQALEADLERECALLREEILFEITPYIKDKYPGTNKNNTFNINAPAQMSWLMFIKLGNDWKKVTKAGRVKSKELLGKIPYNPSARRAFVQACIDNGLNPAKFIQCDKATLGATKDPDVPYVGLARKHEWVKKILEYKKAGTILKTYARGMQKFIKYGVIYPSFNQIGTTSGRYSSSRPNFQNLPRDDKRVKSCIVSRPGRCFVGADYSQLEPRSFTSSSQDPILLAGFKNKEDFYSTIGVPVFGKPECSADKKAPNYLGKQFPGLRQASKAIALGLTYGLSAAKLSEDLGDGYPIKRCTEISEDYFSRLTGVANFVKESHLQVVNTGRVLSTYGRPRRIPEAKKLKAYGFPDKSDASDLPYSQRTLLNLAVNHRVQSTAASIVNRAAIAFCYKMDELGLHNIYIVLQVHDELVVECDDKDVETVKHWLKYCMENTTVLPGVDLIAEPVSAKNLAGLK